MSNPGILVLFSEPKGVGNIKFLQIEDNIGESIHIHINDFRIDLTIDEFNEFSEIFAKALRNLDDTDGRLLLAPQFLAETYKYFNFNRIDYFTKTIKLSDLNFIVRKTYFRFFYLVYLQKINKTPQYKFLIGETQKLEKNYQYNPLQQDGIARLNNALLHVTNHKENFENYNLIMYGENNIIRDGVHTSACLAKFYGSNKDVETIIITNKRKFYDWDSSFLWSLKSFVVVNRLLVKRVIITILYKMKSI